MESQIGAVCILHEARASLSFVHEMTDFTLLGVAVRDLDERRRESYRWGAAHLRPRLYTAAAKHEAQLAVVRYLLETASIASVEMELCAHEPTRNPLFRTCHESNPRPLLGFCRCLMAAALWLLLRTKLRVRCHCGRASLRERPPRARHEHASARGCTAAAGAWLQPQCAGQI